MTLTKGWLRSLGYKEVLLPDKKMGLAHEQALENEEKNG